MRLMGYDVEATPNYEDYSNGYKESSSVVLWLYKSLAKENLLVLILMLFLCQHLKP